MAALTLLALCNIKEGDSWSSANRQSLGVTKGIMTFVNNNYGKAYAPNTRETFRRQVLHQFVQARVADYNPDDPTLPVNSPRAHYALTPEALEVVRAYKTSGWERAVEAFVDTVGELLKLYLKDRELTQIPVAVGEGLVLHLSPGKHNEVQVAIVEEFAPRFASGGKLHYLGDTAKKDLFLDTDTLAGLGIPIDQHSKLPDVVIYDERRNWLFLVEAVTSHGPVSPKRLLELEELMKGCQAGKVYVTAFPNMAEFKKHSNNIAWETEVWLSEIPDHMIHFNGDRFLGPRL